MDGNRAARPRINQLYGQGAVIAQAHFPAATRLPLVPPASQLTPFIFILLQPYAPGKWRVAVPVAGIVEPKVQFVRARQLEGRSEQALFPHYWPGGGHVEAFVRTGGTVHGEVIVQRNLNGCGHCRRMGLLQFLTPRQQAVGHLRPLDFNTGLGCRDCVLQFARLLLINGRGNFDQRRHIPARLDVNTLLVDVVEEGEKFIELTLRNGIVFVIVTASAAHGEAQEHHRHGLDSVHDVFDVPFLFDRSSLSHAAVISIEAGCDNLRRRGLGQEVSGDLFERKLVEG